MRALIDDSDPSDNNVQVYRVVKIFPNKLRKPGPPTDLTIINYKIVE